MFFDSLQTYYGVFTLKVRHCVAVDLKTNLHIVS